MIHIWFGMKQIIVFQQVRQGYDQAKNGIHMWPDAEQANKTEHYIIFYGDSAQAVDDGQRQNLFSIQIENLITECKFISKKIIWFFLNV